MLLGGFILLLVLPALAWVTVAYWRQQAAERQHLREVEEELLRHRDAEEQLRYQLQLQRAFAEQNILEESARGRPVPKDGK
jgi:hypothetical protein